MTVIYLLKQTLDQTRRLLYPKTRSLWMVPPVKMTWALIDGSGRGGPSSPAAGRIVGGNATTPVITVTGLVPGTYTFTLTVWDKSEEKDMKSVKVSVTRDPEILSEVEIILNKDLSHLTEKDKEAVIQRVQVMTRGTGTLTVGHVSVLGDLQSKTATVRFKVFSTEGGKRKVLPGPDVVAQLRRELAADPELLSQVCQEKTI